MTANDPERPSTVLSINGFVIMALEVRPTTVQFGEMFSGESKTLEAKVIPKRGLVFEIDSIQAPGPPFEVEVLPESSLGQSVKNALSSARDNIAERFGSRDSSEDMKKNQTRAADEFVDEDRAKLISVKILPSATVGRYNKTLKIYTNVKEKPLLELRMAANVFGNVKVEPQHHNFGSISCGETKEAIFRITMRKAGIVRITGVETTSEHVLAEVTESALGPGYDLTVRTSPDAPPGGLNGYVTIHTTDEEQPELTVKFYANVRE